MSASVPEPDSTDATPEPPAAAARRALRTRLTAAMKDRDRVAATALRSMIGAIDNAEAIDVTPDPDAAPATNEHVAATAVGVGTTEAPRRRLTTAEVRGLVEDEIADRRAAIAQFAGRGERAEERAAALRHEIDVLSSTLDDLGAAP